MKGVRAVLFGIIAITLTLPAVQAQSYRVVWKNMLTGKVHHGKWMAQKDLAYQFAKTDNAQLAPVISAYVEKCRHLAFIPLAPKRIDPNDTPSRTGATPPTKKDH